MSGRRALHHADCSRAVMVFRSGKVALEYTCASFHVFNTVKEDILNSDNANVYVSESFETNLRSRRPQP